MKKELSFALNYALNKGFQIHPDAFKILENVDVKKLEKTVAKLFGKKYGPKCWQNVRCSTLQYIIRCYC